MIGLFFRVMFAIFLVASFSYAADKAKIVAKDDHYVSYENGIVYDEKTNLEWLTGPDKKTTWYESKEWVDSLTVAGVVWRMPKMDELERLFQKGKGPRNMSPLLKTTGWWVWSGEAKDSSSVYCFGLRNGDRFWYNRGNSKFLRAFAIRSRK